MSIPSLAGVPDDPPAQASAPDPQARWNDLLDAYFPGCLALFWPMLHRDIDWSAAPVSRDADLQQLTGVRPGGQVRRRVDKLFEVAFSGGEPALLFMHVDVQAGRCAAAAPRIYLYHYQLPGAPSGRGVAEPAVRPVLAYRRVPLNGRFGQLEFVFPAVHVPAWHARRGELLALAVHNPFALAVVAELDAARVRTGPERRSCKARLGELLDTLAYGTADVRRLGAFIEAALLPAAA